MKKNVVSEKYTTVQKRLTATSKLFARMFVRLLIISKFIGKSSFDEETGSANSG